MSKLYFIRHKRVPTTFMSKTGQACTEPTFFSLAFDARKLLSDLAQMPMDWDICVLPFSPEACITVEAQEARDKTEGRQ